jgi:DICT domain-containing protein
MEYQSIAGKTIGGAKSWIEDGIVYLELIFTDETEFTFRSRSQPNMWATAFDRDGEVAQNWE